MLKRLETTSGLPGTQVLEMWSRKGWRDWAQELTHLLPSPLRGAESFDKTPTTFKIYYSSFFMTLNLKWSIPHHSIPSAPFLLPHRNMQEWEVTQRATWTKNTQKELLKSFHSWNEMDSLWELCSSRAAVIQKLGACSFCGRRDGLGVV